MKIYVQTTVGDTVVGFSSRGVGETITVDMLPADSMVVCATEMDLRERTESFMERLAGKRAFSVPVVLARGGMRLPAAYGRPDYQALGGAARGYSAPMILDRLLGREGAGTKRIAALVFGTPFGHPGERLIIAYAVDAEGKFSQRAHLGSLDGEEGVAVVARSQDYHLVDFLHVEGPDATRVPVRVFDAAEVEAATKSLRGHYYGGKKDSEWGVREWRRIGLASLLLAMAAGGGLGWLVLQTRTLNAETQRLEAETRATQTATDQMGVSAVPVIAKGMGLSPQALLTTLERTWVKNSVVRLDACATPPCRTLDGRTVGSTARFDVLVQGEIAAASGASQDAPMPYEAIGDLLDRIHQPAPPGTQTKGLAITNDGRSYYVGFEFQSEMAPPLLRLAAGAGR
ncbi:MAG: hypothetical protein F9K47_10400 [Burkholderiales bacterium]|nr:MAG: hypothetical protein F9K47_10400 [Burkholderiales bacterium]